MSARPVFDWNKAAAWEQWRWYNPIACRWYASERDPRVHPMSEDNHSVPLHKSECPPPWQGLWKDSVVSRADDTGKKYALVTPYRDMFRIQALRDFGAVKKGDWGGYVQNEANLSHKGLCWIADKAWVTDSAMVTDDAIVSGSAWVRDTARICGSAVVKGGAEVMGAAIIRGKAVVCGEMVVCDEALIEGLAFLNGNMRIEGNQHITNTSVTQLG